MTKKWLKEHSILLYILLGFVIVITVTIFTFVRMNKEIDKENNEILHEVSNLYISSISNQTINHADIYFESKFALINQTLENTTDINNKADAVNYLTHELSEGTLYIALINKKGECETIFGDNSFHAYDDSTMEDSLKNNKNKVILISDDDNNKEIGIITPKKFSLANNEYIGIICGIPTETLNTIFNLSYGQENLTYSFIIRKADSAFVVRNEGAFRMTYFDRIRALYENYNGMTGENYINNFSDAMKQGTTYSDVFKMNNRLIMFYAAPMNYSDWYLITFIRYEEVNSLLGDNNERSDAIFTRHTSVLVAVNLIIFALYAVFSYFQIRKIQKNEQKALSASKAKSEFLANMSHDIRTPMNAIVGMTGIARAHIDDKARVEDCLHKISLSGQHLIFLINDILDMSKIESGKMTLSFSQMALRESIESIVMIVQPQIKTKNHKFDIFIQNISSEYVYCDSLRLNQILINLVSNAVKYTPEHGNISLTLAQEDSPKGTDYVRTHFIVKDNGIGMTEDFVKIIFNNFVREDRKRITKEEGSGLGLAITKFLVDAMEGTIDVKSKINEGSEFHVTIDLKRCNVNEENIKLNNLHLLIADDDEEQCINTKEILESIGATAEYVLSSKEAINTVTERPDAFNIILIDWQMPGMNGIETSKEIRKITGEKTPIVLISAYDCEGIEQDIKNSGINGFLSKPLFKSTLYYGITQYINKNEMQSEAAEENKQEAFVGEHILLAEDNEINGEIAVEVLTEAGLMVDWVKDGRQCVDKFLAADTEYYKAIIMDIRMPIMNGYEAATAIRALDRPDSDIPIIAATADAFADDVAKAKSCGMNAHIAKPIDTAQLLSTLKKYSK